MDEKTNHKVFIYYDNKNCVGIDFKQPFEMKGLVTISTNNNLSEVAQGIFRLRVINIGNYIDFYYDKNIKDIVKYMIIENASKLNMPVVPSILFTPEPENILTPEGLFYFLSVNDINIKTSIIESAKLQCIKYVNRVEQKYSNISYTEKIFFDSIKLPDTYYTEENFVKMFIESLKPVIICKPINISNVGGLKTNVQQNMNINMNVNMNINMNINIAFKRVFG